MDDKIKKLLEHEFDSIDDNDKKERMKYLLDEYSRPKFKINGPVYAFLITFCICLFWQNMQLRSFIDIQKQEMDNFMIYVLSTYPIEENDSILFDTEPFDSEPAVPEDTSLFKWI